ncbi:MAG: LPXTG-motif cell wall-anchored protein [Gammaproteobacteria bacterium]|jgi:LPXTG-motif cell wall-anchored protein
MRNIFSIFSELLLVSILSLNSVWAGDEDMLNPYTQFDPETGYFIPIDELAVDQKSQDSTMTLDKTVPTTIPDPPEQATIPNLANDSPNPGSPENQSGLILAGIVLLLAGLIFGFRKYRVEAK